MPKKELFDLEINFHDLDTTDFIKDRWKTEEEFQKALPPSDKDIPPMVRALGKSSDYLNIGLEENNVRIVYNKGKLSEYTVGSITFEFDYDGKYTKRDNNNNHSIQYNADGLKIKEIMDDVVFTFSDGKATGVKFLDDSTKSRLAKLVEDVKTADNVDKYKEPQNSSSARFTPLEKIFIDNALKTRERQVSKTQSINASNDHVR